MYQRDHSMVFARPGTGKTLAALMAMDDWKQSGAARRQLVSAPIKVVNSVWRQERDKWGIDLSMSILTGEMSKSQQDDALRAETDVLVCNHNMLGKVLNADHRCSVLMIDELSRFRAHNGTWQKQARNSDMEIFAGLTGSPAPNNYLGLFGMTRAIGLDIFGRNFDKWKRAHFYPTDYNAHNWAPFPGDETVFEAIKPYTYVLDDKSVQLPEIIRPPMPIQLPGPVRQRYNEMRKTSAISDDDVLNNGIDKNTGELLPLTASNAAILVNKLRQIAAGFIYDVRGNPIGIDTFRLDALEDLIEEMQGEPLLVAYEWVEQLAMLRKRWSDVPYLGGGSKGDDHTIKLWNERKLPVLFIHPASAGHGLNMAQGGNSVAWLQPTYDNELYEQLIGRVRRRDQASAQVYSYEFVAENTLDGAVQQKCHQRGVEQDALWGKFKV